MPIYLFECTKCGFIIEDYWEMNKCPKKIKCSKCKGKAKKIPAGGQAFIFKGSGSYVEGFNSPHTKNKKNFKDRTDKEKIDDMFNTGKGVEY